MKTWESPHWNEIPTMEGYFFEISQALSNAIAAISLNEFVLATKYMRRFKVLLRPSGIFDQITPDDELSTGNQTKYFEKHILPKCDSIIKNLEQAESAKKLNLKDVLQCLADIVFILNKYYMYAKTKVCFAGSYKPAFEVFEKEGIK